MLKKDRVILGQLEIFKEQWDRLSIWLCTLEVIGGHWWHWRGPSVGEETQDHLVEVRGTGGDNSVGTFC